MDPAEKEGGTTIYGINNMLYSSYREQFTFSDKSHATHSAGS